MPFRIQIHLLSQRNINSLFQLRTTIKNVASIKRHYATGLEHSCQFPRTPATNRTSFSSSQLTRRSFHSCGPTHFRSIVQALMPQASKPQQFEVTASSPPIDIFEYKPFSHEPKSLIFAHGASGVPKHVEDNNNMVPNANANANAHTNASYEYRSASVGEDSYYRRYDSLGVADGVGGWRSVVPRHGAVPNSAAYSRKLMHHAYMEMELRKGNSFYHYDDADPVQVLKASYENTIRECMAEGIVGSSTALLTILRGDELRIANIGDCTISVIRNNNIIFRNEEMQHSFNFPYQLGNPPIDLPQDAQAFTIKILPGDIIVAGSDGLFDNLFDDDVVEEVRRFTSSGLRVDPQAISDALVRRALSVSEDLEADSPFACRATREGLYYQGGKEDDITVLVALILDAKDDPGTL